MLLINYVQPDALVKTTGPVAAGASKILKKTNTIINGKSCGYGGGVGGEDERIDFVMNWGV